MDDELRGFGSDTFTLNFGPAKRKLYVPQDILVQIPFFRHALSSDSFVESSRKSFDLLEDDVKVVADVLYYTYTDNVPRLSKVLERPYPPEHQAMVSGYIRAYVTADKLMTELTTNRLFDVIVTYLSDQVLNPQDIGILSRANLQESDLYKLFVDELAWFSASSPEIIQRSQSIDLVSVFSSMSQEDTARILVAVGHVDYDSHNPCRKIVEEDLCRFHVHKETPKCVWETSNC
ncbi:hypothetical protein H2198_005390 [Neophaeococcomyces mojaviensis]|uniref:Uncharacterized protein n=1 Tax=Neophaeococcomyces mojaviensis TaxID=3383035 RepID=A0ACC3A6G7_9EURO|nr:hypothetical protein H2198_005390 [Knufia sp. JES_112]